MKMLMEVKNKRKTLPPNCIIDFFSGLNPYKPNDLGQLNFIEDLVLLIAKGYLTLSIDENPRL